MNSKEQAPRTSLRDGGALLAAGTPHARRREADGQT